MRRRNVLIGVSGLATAGLVGASAVTSVSAERTVEVATADDDSALLRLEPLVDDGIGGDPTGRSGTYGSTVWFEIPGEGSGENQNAKGVGQDSVYEFHDLLRIENRGTQSVNVYSKYDGDALADLALVRDSGVLRDDPPSLGVGQQLDVGLHIDTHGSDLGKYDETLTIVADGPDD